MMNAKLVYPHEFKVRGYVFDDSWSVGFSNGPEVGEITWMDFFHAEKREYFCFWDGETTIRRDECFKGKEFDRAFKDYKV